MMARNIAGDMDLADYLETEGVNLYKKKLILQVLLGSLEANCDTPLYRSFISHGLFEPYLTHSIAGFLANPN